MRAAAMGTALLLALSVLVAPPGLAGQDTDDTRGMPAGGDNASTSAPGPPVPAGPATAKPASGGELAGIPGQSPWYDTVHYLGIVGGALSFPALLLGAVIYFGFARRKAAYDRPPRKGLRQAHMAVGALAVALSLAHYFGRWVQEGGPNFGFEPPHLSGLFYLMLGVSGVLRFAPPRAWRKRYLIFAHLHRAAFLVALLTMILHALNEIANQLSQTAHTIVGE